MPTNKHGCYRIGFLPKMSLSFPSQHVHYAIYVAKVDGYVVFVDSKLKDLELRSSTITAVFIEEGRRTNGREDMMLGEVRVIQLLLSKCNLGTLEKQKVDYLEDHLK